MTEPYDLYDYPRYWRGREYEDRSEKMALQKFIAKIPNRNSLIDIGGGFGRLAEIYAPIFKKCLLVDPSQRLLDQAQKRFRRYSYFELKKGNIKRISATDEEFEVALLVRVIHHLADPLLAFREVNRILKPGGFFILEFANKIHFLAVLRAWLKGDFDFTRNLQPLDQRSAESIAKRTILFLNHHPQFIRHQLEKSGFRIIFSLSVSNLRYSFLKKIIPMPILLFLESICQQLLASCHFGPSIFLLCQKE